VVPSDPQSDRYGYTKARVIHAAAFLRRSRPARRNPCGAPLALNDGASPLSCRRTRCVRYCWVVGHRRENDLSGVMRVHLRGLATAMYRSSASSSSRRCGNGPEPDTDAGRALPITVTETEATIEVQGGRSLAARIAKAPFHLALAPAGGPQLQEQHPGCISPRPGSGVSRSRRSPPLERQRTSSSRSPVPQDRERRAVVPRDGHPGRTHAAR